MNDLLLFANEIKKTARQLVAEVENPDQNPEDEILIDDKEKKRIGKEIQAYVTFIRKFLQPKGNDKIFAKLNPLFDNPRLKKARNAILLTLEQGKKDEQVITKDVAQTIMDLKRILMRYTAVDRYPAVKLLKEILNFGVVNGVPAFKRLLTTERRLYNTFGTQGTLEKDKQKQEKEQNQ